MKVISQDQGYVLYWKLEVFWGQLDHYSFWSLHASLYGLKRYDNEFAKGQ